MQTILPSTQFGDSTGESSQSAIMSDDKAELNSGNIIKPTLDELSEEYRQKYEQRLQEFEDAQRRRKQEFEDTMLSCFQKTRQGVIMKEPDLPSVTEASKVGPVSEITHGLKEEMAIMIDQSVGASVHNTHEKYVRNLDSMIAGHVKNLFEKMQVSNSVPPSVPYSDRERDRQPLATDASTSNNNAVNMQHGAIPFDSSALFRAP